VRHVQAQGSARPPAPARRKSPGQVSVPAAPDSADLEVAQGLLGVSGGTTSRSARKRRRGDGRGVR